MPVISLLQIFGPVILAQPVAGRPCLKCARESAIDLTPLNTNDFHGDGETGSRTVLGLSGYCGGARGPLDSTLALRRARWSNNGRGTPSVAVCAQGGTRGLGVHCQGRRPLGKGLGKTCGSGPAALRQKRLSGISGAVPLARPLCGPKCEFVLVAATRSGPGARNAPSDIAN